jgi:hypothetical protein
MSNRFSLPSKNVSKDRLQAYALLLPEPLAQLFRDADLHNVEVRAIDIPTQFRDFDDYWSPFFCRTGTCACLCNVTQQRAPGSS